MYGANALAAYPSNDSAYAGSELLASKNVVGHPLLRELWAPLGLRHHALHHLFPAAPYHAQGDVHRRLQAALAESALYRA